MTTDYRAMCAELLKALESWSPGGGGPLEDADEIAEAHLIDRARALLDQPEPEGPTDDKLMDIARANDLVYYMGKDCGFASPYMEGTDITAEVLAFARAAIAKWGRQ